MADIYILIFMHLLIGTINYREDFMLFIRHIIDIQVNNKYLLNKMQNYLFVRRILFRPFSYNWFLSEKQIDRQKQSEDTIREWYVLKNKNLNGSVDFGFVSVCLIPEFEIPTKVRSPTEHRSGTKIPTVIHQQIQQSVWKSDVIEIDWLGVGQRRSWNIVFVANSV